MTTHSLQTVVIVSIARTPIGNLMGELNSFTAPQLGAAAIKAAIERAKITGDAIQEVMMGNVLPAGLGQAPARQAALFANLNANTGCTTISKVCGSGMKAIMLAHDMIQAGSANIIIGGGMESMTHAPYLLSKARTGYRLGHQTLIDHMMMDGLENAYDHHPMGYFADQCAVEQNITRKEQDDYAISSFERAKKATQQGFFQSEIVPLTHHTKQGDVTITHDERPNSVSLEKLTKLNAVFTKDGTVTAGNASSIADGAAALVVMSLAEATARGLTPLATIKAHTSHAEKPAHFTIAPVGAITNLLQKMNWTVNDVDLFEINEAFAVVALAAMKALDIPREKVNIHGGACALGHPIGASGARIVVTLIAALKQQGLKRGVASLCIGGGEATAIAVEMI